MGKKRKRALSPSEVCKIKHKTFPLQGRWAAALGEPETSGIWIIYGASGNGKSSFVMELVKELCKYDKVIYNSLEEGLGKSFADNLARHRMGEVDKRLQIYEKMDMEVLKAKLLQKRTANIAIIDSVQETELTSKPKYQKWKEELEDKLIIFVSQVDEKGNPAGAVADKIKYDSMIKIHVSGLRAECISRFSAAADEEGKPIEKVGCYEIWEERSAEIWGQQFEALGHNNTIENGEE